MAAFTVAEVAAACGGRVVGDGAARVSGVRALENAGPESLSFAIDAKALKRASASRAGAFLARSASDLPGRTVVEVADPQQALIAVLRLFHPLRTARPGIHPTAVVDPGATVDPSAEIGPYAVIGAGTVVGAGVVVEAHAVVGAGCRVGAGSWLHPHVVLYDRVTLGERVEVHGGAVLGADGFGYATTARGLVKIPQVGTVSVGDDVEIGANTCIDRAALETTTVGAGTKVDNLVQIGHNVVVGEDTILCAQVGLAGSTIVGRGVTLAGQVGVAGHCEIGDGVIATAQTGIPNSVEAGKVVSGYPAIENRAWLKSSAVFNKLPELQKAVRRLERGLADRAGDDESGVL